MIRDMIISKEAIEKAIEGGWDCKIVKQEPLEMRRKNSEHISHTQAALDPLFWQALGKSLGWEMIWNGQYMNTRHNPKELVMVEGWEYNAHRLYDLILTNGDTDAYWEEILK